jgi:tripartite-type tricarboxylate transporter receptor subunit TctC
MTKCLLVAQSSAGGDMPIIKIFASAIAFILVIAPVKAQNWPTRPITMVITYAAGSWNDILGRILAPPLSASLGQQVVVEDVDGAGGMIGAARVARAAPDGHDDGKRL